MYPCTLPMLSQSLNNMNSNTPYEYCHYLTSQYFFSALTLTPHTIPTTHNALTTQRTTLSYHTLVSILSHSTPFQYPHPPPLTTPSRQVYPCANHASCTIPSSHPFSTYPINPPHTTPSPPLTTPSPPPLARSIHVQITLHASQNRQARRRPSSRYLPRHPSRQLPRFPRQQLCETDVESVEREGQAKDAD